MNAPCHGWQVSKQAMDGLPEKTERYSQKNRTFSGTIKKGLKSLRMALVEWGGFFAGLLQGLTEFLPVSSSGHLFLLEKILRLTENPLSFFLALHLATALSIVTVFFKDIKRLLFSFPRRETRRLFFQILTALFPLAVVGLFFQSAVETHGFQNGLVGGGFLLTGLLLFIPRFLFKKTGREMKKMTYSTAFLIGLFQALAVLPGFSRSGWTITAGRLFGLNSRSAVAFSFLIALPAILGSALVFFFRQGPSAPGLFSPEMLWAFVTAFVSGVLSLLLVLKLVSRKKFYLFGFYLVPLGCWLLFFS